MARIKNWKRLKAGQNVEMVWKNTENGQRVDIRKLSNGNYKIIFPDYNSFHGTKEAARKSAVEWMRSHPVGV